MALFFAVMALPKPAFAQFGRLIRPLATAAACGGGAVAGVRLGEKIAEFEARRLNLGAEEAAKHRRAFQIGIALALCAGGAAIANTTFSKLSERGKQARERELLAAVEDAQPRAYRDPERPNLEGTLTTRSTNVEGDRECRVIEDYLADGAQGDTALVKYCRPTAGGAWKVETL